MFNISTKACTPLTTMQLKQLPNFLSKLYAIMKNPIYNHIITWDEAGTKIIVRNKKTLEREVLPSEFKHKKFDSFQRQLNMYSFYCVANVRFGHTIYSHEFFKRDEPQLISRIVRT